MWVALSVPLLREKLKSCCASEPTCEDTMSRMHACMQGWNDIPETAARLAKIREAEMKGP